VARLRQGESGRDGLEVTHFATRITLGSSRQNRSWSRSREGVGIVSEFTLVHGAASVGVDELDRVLDGDDVSLFLLVDEVDHRREGRGLTGPVGRLRRPGRGEQGQLADGLGEAEGLDRRMFSPMARHARHAAPLHEHVHGGTGRRPNADRESPARAPPRTAPFGHREDAVDQRLRVVRGQFGS